jgi:hypothetical protein
MIPERRVKESPMMMSEVIATLNSPESLLYAVVYTSVRKGYLDLEELGLRFRTARTPRSPKRHVVNWTFFRDSTILKG